MLFFACSIEIFLLLPGIYGSCPKSDAPDPPTEGKIVFESNSDPAPEGSKASLECRGAYRPQDSNKRLQCNSGAWAGELGACKGHSCNKRHLTDLVAPSGTFNFGPSNDTERAEHLSCATYACASGFGLKSRELEDKIICEAGKCEEGYALATLNDTYLCHFGMWVGKMKNNYCVPLREDDIPTLSAECMAQSPWSLELGRSCFVLAPTSKTVAVAHQSCSHLPDFPGHLAQVAENDNVVSSLIAFLNTKSVASASVGLERLDTSGVETEGWYFVTDKGNWTAEHHTIAWGPEDPKTDPTHTCTCLFPTAGLGPLRTTTCNNRQYYCQYESRYKIYTASTRDGEKGSQVLVKHQSVSARVDCAKLCSDSECPVCLQVPSFTPIQRPNTNEQYIGRSINHLPTVQNTILQFTQFTLVSSSPFRLSSVS